MVQDAVNTIRIYPRLFNPGVDLGEMYLIEGMAFRDALPEEIKEQNNLPIA